MMNIFKNALPWSAVLAFCAPGLAHAAPLTVVNVGAPAINCVFNVTCTITVSDTVGNFTLPFDSGTGRLQSRTFVGAPPAPAGGLNGYDYRVDMTSMNGITAKNCVSAMKIDFGPMATENYKPGTPSQVYVVTSGGLGSVGLASAVLSGSVVTFTFDGAGVCPGQTSYFFGLAAKSAPAPTTARLVPTLKGPEVAVDARSPKH